MYNDYSKTTKLVQWPFISVSLGDLMPEKKTFIHCYHVFVIIQFNAMQLHH